MGALLHGRYELSGLTVQKNAFSARGTPSYRRRGSRIFGVKRQGLTVVIPNAVAIGSMSRVLVVKITVSGGQNNTK